MKRPVKSSAGRAPSPGSYGGGLPFGEPERPKQMHIANVDGASRGNPGPASYGLVLRGPDGVTKCEMGKYVGRTTNNVAEYFALIAALDFATANGIDSLKVQSDSELLVRQMQGRYKVKSPDLRPLYERAQKLAHGLAHFAIEHVPRERNAAADALANLALDQSSMSGVNHAASSQVQGQAKPQAPLQSSAQPQANAPAREPRVTKTIKARYSASALHPLEALDLDEGEMVEVRISRIRPA